MTFWPAYKANRRFAADQNVAEKNPTKAAGRLGFFVARAAYWRRAYTGLLCEVKTVAPAAATDGGGFILYLLFSLFFPLLMGYFLFPVLLLFH
jgi:hypothetical protein